MTTETHWLAAVDYNEFGRCWEAVCDCFDPDPETSGSPIFRSDTQVDAINLWADHLAEQTEALAIRDYRVAQLRKQAEASDDAWKRWGDSNDAANRDHFWREANRIADGGDFT